MISFEKVSVQSSSKYRSLPPENYAQRETCSPVHHGSDYGRNPPGSLSHCYAFRTRLGHCRLTQSVDSWNSHVTLPMTSVCHVQAITLLGLGMYPNVCYHKEKRKVLTVENKAALVHMSSVNCSNTEVHFPSPFFVFGEKLRLPRYTVYLFSPVTDCLHRRLFSSQTGSPFQNHQMCFFDMFFC